jgi:hypothetical protein
MVEFKIFLVLCFICLVSYETTDVGRHLDHVKHNADSSFNKQLIQLDSLENRYAREIAPMKEEIKNNTQTIKEHVVVLKKLDTTIDSVIQNKVEADKLSAFKKFLKKFKNQ